ncbi:MAG: hypothetical protein WDN10_05215 [bacterium]
MNHDSMREQSEDRDPVSRRVLEHIEREQVRPLPRSRFVLQNVALWVFGILSILFGAIAAAAALFALANAGWRYYVATHDTFLTFLIETAPLLWIVTLAFFVLIGYQIFRRTRRGYRYPFIAVAATSVAASLLLGAALYGAGFGEVIEEGLGAHVPFYRPALQAEQVIWAHPERGLLAGRVTGLAPDFSSFTLLGFDGKLWNVEGSDLRRFDEATLAHGGLVRIVGVPLASTTEDAAFHACFVFPWEIYGSFAERRAPMPFPYAGGERKIAAERSEECKGVRPYAPLRALEEQGHASSTEFTNGS